MITFSGEQKNNLTRIMKYYKWLDGTDWGKSNDSGKIRGTNINYRVRFQGEGHDEQLKLCFPLSFFFFKVFQ